MENKTFDLDDYISQRKERDSEFAKNFDTGYEEFKIGMMIKEMRLESGMTQEQLAEKLETLVKDSKLQCCKTIIKNEKIDKYFF